MFDNLKDRLQSVIRGITNNDKLTPENMQEVLREIRRALLEADVNLKVVKSFISNIKDKAEGESVINSVSPAQLLVKIVSDELTKILGAKNEPLNLSGKPAVIMMLGLQGSGKTTSSAKLALKLKKTGYNPLLVACDVYRPAAVAQLKTLGEQTNTPVFVIENSTDVRKIATDAITFAKENNLTPIILDTAGRLQIDTEMMAELLILDRLLNPQEKLLVIDSMTGQEAINVAENFNTQLEITGIVLTKLDGDSRGGAALSVVQCTNKPIKLTGTGEKLEALEDFHPDRIATRILGMGDIVTLVERASEAFDAKEAKMLEEKMQKAEFSFDDFLKMQKQMKMLGSLEGILSMLPVGGLKKEDKELIAHEGEQQFKKIEVFISSMTADERANPTLLNASRKKRIAIGCGLGIEEVNMIVKQFDQMRTMMKGFGQMKNNFKKSKGKIPKGMLGGNRLPF